MEIIKKFKAPLILALLFLVLAFLLPEIAARSAAVSFSYFKEMALVLPPVFILMGLLEVWVPKEKIRQLIGRESGIKGMFFSFLMGTLPTKISNIVIFLGAWAAIKIPQLIAETEFLGLQFTALRFILTLTAVVIIGLIMEKLLKADDIPAMTEQNS